MYTYITIAYHLSSSSIHPDYITASVPTITFAATGAAAAAQLNGTYNNSPVSVKYYVTSTGTAALVYTFEIQNIALGTWYRAFVDAHSAHFNSALSYVAHATVGPPRCLLRISGYLLMFNTVHCRSAASGFATIKFNGSGMNLTCALSLIYGSPHTAILFIISRQYATDMASLR